MSDYLPLWAGDANNNRMGGSAGPNGGFDFTNGVTYIRYNYDVGGSPGTRQTPPPPPHGFSGPPPTSSAFFGIAPSGPGDGALFPAGPTRFSCPPPSGPWSADGHGGSVESLASGVRDLESSARKND